MLEKLKTRARHLKTEANALYLAARDPRTPWYAKLMVAGVAAYALSPIDLIPDFIPVLGYLDDLILVPAGIALALRLIPAPILSECRAQAESATQRPGSRVAAALIFGMWLVLACACLIWAYEHYHA
ncbi:MAG: DUF1232 domain-containing protein [Gammaproteobacteria bacterium]|nr:DUF1232 domain-containing protein [Gammaproteobacteria bacterium]